MRQLSGEGVNVGARAAERSALPGADYEDVHVVLFVVVRFELHPFVAAVARLRGPGKSVLLSIRRPPR